ncbi:MAG: hypothetical protein ACD_72C00146G0001, partial [uncultured bacterium]
MPQTRFVLKKALAMKLKIIVVVNKIDKPDARPAFALDKTFDLFLELGADDETANFPVIYASAKQGLAGLEPDLAKMTDISPLFDTVLSYIPEPSGDADQPLQMLITTLTADNYKGRIATGKLLNGRMKAGQEIARIRRDGTISKHRLVALMSFEGLDRCVAENVEAGDIVAVAGIPDPMIGETIADPINPI